ncbi:uncharacterized protein MONOS_9819 [Monocercomonoides exilis]|uniref:uncharacterized protein n=1 Tax=Monocercomonoides exilis TaxID=2049356 RepID=UPI00355A0362|nr:hypothetical protein MONOS_9819 [Monocercomonoides exilis]|eukprot:MONOS_9819.1-p1 / transcript=MONOS_9819.1 / gene=MONOS_9819 / organism=Monocercomonoides_exilis_PA203 / gene_product=unspecified product / transcript_product=unspecified product / location=Mono_scaffold00420:809-1909(-) / protein_length=367 / sequence_SO=supercontig / SO=protein_coding / is_pseudo=false
MREAIRELEELEGRVNWMKRGKFLNEVMDEITLTRWLDTLGYYFFFYEWKEIKSPNFFECIVRILRKAKKYHRKVFKRCVYVISRIANPVSSDISYLLRSGIIRIVMEEMQQPTVRRDYLEWCLKYIISLVRRVSGPSIDASEREKRKMQKHQILGILEEEGYEDEIISVYECMVKTLYFYFPIKASDMISLSIQKQKPLFLCVNTKTGRNNPFEANPFKTGQHSNLQFGAIPPSVNQFLVLSVAPNPFATASIPSNSFTASSVQPATLSSLSSAFSQSSNSSASSSHSEEPHFCILPPAPNLIAPSTGPFAPSPDPFSLSSCPSLPSSNSEESYFNAFSPSPNPIAPSADPSADSFDEPFTRIKS